MLRNFICNTGQQKRQKKKEEAEAQEWVNKKT